MNTTILSHNRTIPTEDLYSIFYVRADNCDGENYDLAVVAGTEQQAIDIWAQHFYPDETASLADTSFIAGRWADEGIGIMTMAAHGDLEQIGLEPGPIHWEVQGFDYQTTTTSGARS